MAIINPGLERALRRDALDVLIERNHKQRVDDAAGVLAGALHVATLEQVEEVLRHTEDTTGRATARVHIAGLLSLNGVIAPLAGNRGSTGGFFLGSSGDAAVFPVKLADSQVVDMVGIGKVEYTDIRASVTRINHKLDTKQAMDKDWNPNGVTPYDILEAGLVVTASTDEKPNRYISAQHTWLGIDQMPPKWEAARQNYVRPKSLMGTLRLMYGALGDPELNPEAHTADYLKAYNPDFMDPVSNYAADPESVVLANVDVREFMPAWLTSYAE